MNPRPLAVCLLFCTAFVLVVGQTDFGQAHQHQQQQVNNNRGQQLLPAAGQPQQLVSTSAALQPQSHFQPQTQAHQAKQFQQLELVAARQQMPQQSPQPQPPPQSQPQQPQKQLQSVRQVVHHSVARSSESGITTSKPSAAASFFDRIRTGEILRPTTVVTGKPKEASSTKASPVATELDRALNLIEEDEDDDEDEAEDDDDDEDDDDEEDDEDDDEEEDESDGRAVHLDSKNPSDRIVTDIFGNKIKLQNNRTILVSQNKARDLGMLTIKAILLGPLIGLTLKAALMRGLLWALVLYFTHVFFPTLLTSLGLGTGLVGFARQMQPDYTQMLLPHLTNLPATLRRSLPPSVVRLTTQYSRVFQPVIESIRSIPEGPCRFRAVCETASYLIKNTQSMSSSLQRISATIYLNFGTEYSKAWLDGIVQSDCAVRYAQCTSSPLSNVASRLAEAVPQFHHL